MTSSFNLVSSIAIFSYALLINAYEVDQFSGIDAKPAIKDSSDLVNQELNRRVDFAILEANSANGGLLFSNPCDSKDKSERAQSRVVLFEKLRDTLSSGDNPVGYLERFAENDKRVDKRIIPFEKSIYADLPKNSILSIIPTVGINAVIKIGNTEIGTDKLGHFLTQGYSYYFSQAGQKKSSTRRSSSERYSMDSEKDWYGGMTTGVISYGDHSANAAGFKFWNKMCGVEAESSKERDEIKYFEENRCYPDSYIRCEKGKWVRNTNNKIDIRDFVDDSWDESINCSSYTWSEEHYNKVFSNMTQRVYQWKGNAKQPCPRDPKKCLDLVTKNSRTLNPICEKVGFKMRKGIASDPNIKFDYKFVEKKQNSPAERAKFRMDKNRNWMENIKKIDERR